MARAPLTPIFILALTLPALAATDDELRRQLIGNWAETPQCTGNAVTFNDDGTFVSRDAGTEDPADDRRGTYQVAQGKLTGEADGLPMPEVTIRIEGDRLFFDGQGGSSESAVRCTEQPERATQ
jgi:hypothetical protein